MRPPLATALSTLVPPLLAALPCAAVPAQAPSKELAEVAAAYAAKIAASAIFVSGRTLESVLAEELSPTRPLETLIRPLLRFDVDTEAGTVTCRLGQAKATAVRTKGLGCTLALAPVTVEQLRAREGPAPDLTGADAPWPLGESVPEIAAADIDHEALAKALDAAFAGRDPKRPVHTRAVVVVHRGRLVAERYGDGYHARMPLPGWSMAKTLTHALLGVRERARPGLMAKNAARAWPSNLRGPSIYAEEPPEGFRPLFTVDHLLTMTAGMGWTESYDDPTGDVLTMLFRTPDHATAYRHSRKGLITEPGSTFVYSSGATNLLCELLRSTFAGERAYHAFPREHLFAKLGMRTAVLETDPSGTFVGSSYGFASARDWARLGMLYAQRGEFAGQRVVDAEWIDGAFEPAAGSNGRFGRHLWLDRDPDGDGPQQREWPDLPEDLGYMSGHEGQYCVVIPSEQLVVVRLGCTKSGGFSIGDLVRGVRAAIRR
jgi:CubicO group peptidase (beta-lactamase class C family)